LKPISNREVKQANKNISFVGMNINIDLKPISNREVKQANKNISFVGMNINIKSEKHFRRFHSNFNFQMNTNYSNIEANHMTLSQHCIIVIYWKMKMIKKTSRIAALNGIMFSMEHPQDMEI